MLFDTLIIHIYFPIAFLDASGSAVFMLFLLTEQNTCILNRLPVY